MNRIRIAYVVETIVGPTAGTEKQLLMLLRNLDRDRFTPTLVCLRSSPWLERQPFPFEVLDLYSLRSRSFVTACREFRKLHESQQFDIVQTFSVDSNYFGTIAARLAGIRTVISSRRDVGYWQTRIPRALLRGLRFLTPYYLANSRAAAEACIENEGVDPDKVTVIYNGIDLDRFRNLTNQRAMQRKEWGVEDDEVVVGAIANLRPVKNLEALVEAAAEICREMPKVRFVVVGEGPSRRALEDAIGTAGLESVFQLVGGHFDTVSCVAALDLAVLCSKSESLSNALLEYMAAGLPVVASAVGGATEVLEHAETGMLYDPNDPAGLVSNLRAILRDAHEAKRLGEAARESAFSHYGQERCVRLHEDFYQSVAPGRNGYRRRR